MLLAILFLSGMDGVLKMQSTRFPLFQVLFFRYLFGALPVLVLVGVRGQWSLLRPEKFWVHAVRILCGLGALACFVFALRSLSLASAVTIFFAAPILLAVLSLVMLNQRPTLRIAAAIVIGMLGVVVALRPGEGILNPITLLVLLAATAYAIAQVLAHKYAKSESAESMTLSLNVGGALICATFVFFDWQAPSTEDWLWFALMGTLGGTGLFFLTEAMRVARPSALAPFEYTAVIWAVGLDFVFWNLLPDGYTLVGCTLITVSGIMVARAR